jgi:hypothetical protein
MTPPPYPYEALHNLAETRIQPHQYAACDCHGADPEYEQPQSIDSSRLGGPPQRLL